MSSTMIENPNPLSLDEIKEYRKLTKKYPSNVSSKIIDRLLDQIRIYQQQLDELHMEAASKIEVLTDWSRCPFGKYKGTPMEHVPDDYLRWWLEQNKERGVMEMDAEFQPFPARAAAIQKLKLYDYVKARLEYVNKDKDGGLRETEDEN